MLGKESKTCPTMLSLKETSDKDSMYNTPPCYAIYMVGLVLEWIRRQGGVAEMARRSAAKSQLLYSTIDESPFYVAPVATEVRSRMNVRFNLRSGDKALEKKFVEQATARGLIGLEGHRVLGGFRASLYNSVCYSCRHSARSFPLFIQ
jgi:phosphoserine aminotransferase